ncbi:MAG TPA: DUF488 family protein [Streptosporangiaceae bacterium]|nr:DUF488 family protein [Streptosporangiaceae bacterium]
MVRLRRVYEEPSPEDGTRVLVDRLWPRGLTKEKAALDEWLKDVAPSTELRRWYGHDPARFEEFRRRYERELDGPEQAAALAGLRDTAGQQTVTLLTATKDIDHSEAAVLADLLGGLRGGAEG